MTLLLLVAALLAPAALGQIIFPVPKVVNVGVVATTDLRYRACTAVNAHLDACYTSLGGTDISLAPVASVRKCACCFEATPISPAYFTCATFIRTESPLLSSEYSSEFSPSCIMVLEN
jgi:hypothetical protein